MNTKQYFFSEQFKQLSHHTVEATINILGFNNATVREHLAKELNYHGVHQKKMDSLIGSPVFDVLFPWQGQNKHPQELTYLLHPKVIQNIYKPYKHQLQAWELLQANHQEPQSLIITSGTGSGKTECFMIPIIDSLVKAQQKHQEPLEGVEALFLYPLNALINSQKQRLNEATKDFGNNIRFCLYNGTTPELHKGSHKNKPNQVLSREKLRMSPPPILVTNATMLEYMLIRQKDQDIIQKSQGKLRWIVLDEAHSYIGSTASELALLLRRVMIAFGVEAKNVHFIATSATIGEDEEAKRKLIDFLADLSGTPSQNIHIITGSRDVPKIINQYPNINQYTATLQQIEQIDQDSFISIERYNTLSKHPFAHALRNQFVDANGKTHPKSLDELLTQLAPLIHEMMLLEQTQQSIYQNSSRREYLLKWLDILSYSKPSTQEDQPAFLPLRAHLFQRTLTGLYACVNPDCHGKHAPYSNLAHQHNGVADWPFGYLYGNQHQQCDYCGSPVYEAVFCTDCKTPHLIAMDDAKYKEANLKLVHFSKTQRDEFSLTELQDDDENPQNDEQKTSTYAQFPIVIMPPLANQPLSAKSDAIQTTFDEMFLNKQGIVFPTPQEDTIPVTLLSQTQDDQSTLAHCYFCESSSKGTILKSAHLGAPFYMSEAIPTLLDYCDPYAEHQHSLPYQGKRMITFTDSRQGTARISMKLSQDSERRTLRHIVYNHLAQKQEHNTLSSDELENKQQKIQELQTKIALLQSMGDMQAIIETVEKEINLLQQSILQKPSAPVMSWLDMIEAIQKDNEFRFLKNSIARIAYVNKLTHDRDIAELLLLNELTRRPKNANSLETMGLVYFKYPQLEHITLKNRNLIFWQELGFKAEHWQDFLKLLIDFYIREYKFVDLTIHQVRSLSGKFFGKLELLAPNTHLNLHEKDSKNIRPWLQVNSQSPNHSQRLIKLLAVHTGANLADTVVQDKINSLLEQAWIDLIEAKLLTRSTRQNFSTYQFDFKNASLTIPTDVYICPVTNRLLDTTLMGITPYLPPKQNILQLANQKHKYQCESVSIPIFKPDILQANYSDQARVWLTEQPVIHQLRAKNQWTDVSDSVILGMNTIATEEHSAQISSQQLEKYEKGFQNGEINILNCSTTMEMGVDIGGISSVAMNNVPPHPANYLQRTGRAGRRGESKAIAFTLCKNNPHEQTVFNNTRWAFDTQIKPPYIKLNSLKIIQRHINAYLLGIFLNQQSAHSDTNVLLKSGDFFLAFPESVNTAYLDQIIQKIEEHTDDTIWQNLFIHTKYKQMHQWLNTLKLQDNLSPEKAKINQDIQAIIQKSEFIHIDSLYFIENCIKNLEHAKRFIVDRTINKLKEYQNIKSSKHKLNAYLKKLAKDISSISNAYLLADLARLSFLPRYGFPSGIVEFDIYNSAQNKKETNFEHNLSIRDDVQNLIDGKPTRDLAIALREYSPGNEVAVNGLIYQSAGLELSQYLNYTNNNDAQILRYFSQCTSCGAIDYDVNINHPFCPSCDQQIQSDKIIKFVEPMGFKVDYISKPHTKIENQIFVPVIDPKIQANTEILALPNPALGSYRTDDDGKIFHQSSGTHNYGYFICLHCGRAVSSSHPEGSANFEKEKNEFANNHYPMKPLKELQELTEDNIDQARGFCKNIGHSIQHMHIGATDTTNVFELYLKNPNTYEYFNEKDNDHKTLLLTLAVVFRNALAECHGINVDELGCGTKAIRINQNPILAIYIYDKASGGAGFSSIANQYIIPMFKKAYEMLRCPDHCDSACNSCLIDYDTRFIAHQLDRHLALDYLSKVQHLIELPENAQNLLPQAQYCVQSIAQTVAENLNREFDSISLYLQGDASQWTLSSAIREKILLWQQFGKKIEISIAKSALNQMEKIDKDYLASLPKAFPQVSLTTWAEYGDYLNNNILLQLTASHEQHQHLTLAITDRQALIANENLWRVSDHAIIVQSNTAPKVITTPLEIEASTQKNSNNALQLEIKNELNAPINKFGENFWHYLQNHHSELASRIATQNIEKLEYSDAYIRSPLVVLLLSEVLYQLKQLTQSMPTLTIKTTAANDTRDAYWLQDNWNDTVNQKMVIEKYFTDCGFENESEICQIYQLNELSHHRSLTITWHDNSKTTIYFDHGFGFLKCQKDYSGLLNYPFKENHDQQIAQLERVSKLSTPIFSKENATTLITIKISD